MKTLCPLGNKKNSYTLFQIKQNQINSWGFGYPKNQTNLPLSRDFWWFKLYAFAFYFDFKFKSSIKLMESLDFIFYSLDNKSDVINDHAIKLSLDLNEEGKEFAFKILRVLVWDENYEDEDE